MKKIFLAAFIVGLLICSAGVAVASSVDISGSVARGQADSMAYQLGVTQTYDPLISNEVLGLTPFIGLSGHLWVPSDGDNVWGATFAPGLTLDFFTRSNFQPYLKGAVGPTVLSKRHVDDRDLGSNVVIMTRGALGANFGDNLQHHIEGQYTHHSTWGITNHDEGYDTYGVSYGYSF